MPPHHHFELTSHQPRNPAGVIGPGVLAPGLGMFADKLPSAIFGFRLHQCQDSFWPEPSELPARQRKQPGQPGAVQSSPGRQRCLHSPRQGHAAGESQHSPQSHSEPLTHPKLSPLLRAGRGAAGIPASLWKLPAAIAGECEALHKYRPNLTVRALF